MPRESFFNVTGIFQDRRKLAVFLTCVLLSAIMWMLISLSREYTTTLIVPVQYTNFPENKTLLNSIPDYLAVNVSGSGYDLLQYNDRLKEDTLFINLDNLKMSDLGEYQRGYLDPALLTKNLQQRLDGGLIINRVLSDSITFIFDLKVTRLVKVKPAVNYTLVEGFVLLDSVVASPAEVEINGALSVLDTLRYIRTMPISTGPLKASAYFKVALALESVGGETVSETDSVTVVMSIDQLTEKRFMITPAKHNVPKALTMLTFPNSIEVNAQVPLSRFDDVTEKDFMLVLDYNDLEEGYPVLPVKLEQWPVLAERVSVKPQQVEIVLSRDAQ